MPIQHVIQPTEDIYSITEMYLKDPTRWKEIVDYNKLEYPYIVSSRLETKGIRANGYIHVTRTSFTGRAVLKKGWTVRTKPFVIGGGVKEYEISEDAVFESGERDRYVHIQAKLAGERGNIGEGLIVVVGQEFRNNGIQINSIINEQPFTNGTSPRLLTIGDTIFIPSEDDNQQFFDTEDYALAYLLGEDLELSMVDGERTFSTDYSGDFRTLVGVENIKQAIHDRLLAEKGELPLHPEYGTGIASLIGNASVPYLEKLIEIEIYQALAYEDRISDVSVIKVEKIGTSVLVDIEFTVDYLKIRAMSNLRLDYSKGGITHV